MFLNFSGSFLAASFALCTAAYSSVSIEVVHRRAADVFELLDSTSHWYPGFNYDEYVRFWKDSAPTLPGDLQFFEKYSSIRKKYFIEPDEKDPFKNPHGFFSSPSSSGGDPFANAFYSSAQVDEALVKLGQIVNGEELAFLKDFYAHFKSRYSSLLPDHGTFAEMVAKTSIASKPNGHQEYLEKLSRFFGVSSDIKYEVLLIWWPPVSPTWDNAAGDRLLLRRNPSKHAEVYVADIVMHELTHALSLRQSPGEKRTFTDQFLKICPVQKRVKKLGIFEEPLAVAVGQMYFTERFYPERFNPSEKWYVVPWYNLFARLIYPIAHQYVAEGKRMDQNFIGHASKLCAEAIEVADQLGIKDSR